MSPRRHHPESEARRGSPRRSSPRRAGTAVAVLLTLAALTAAALTGCIRGQAGPPGEPAATAAPQGVPVVTAPARHERLRAVTTAPGEVRPLRTVQVAPKAAGRIAAVQASLGDTVAAGDLLVRLEDDEARARVDQARASLAQAVAQQDAARREAERTAALLAAGAVTRQQDDSARSQAALADAAVAAAKAALALAQLSLDATVVTAPVAGTIAARYAEPGNFVGPGATLFHLVDIAQVRVAADLAEPDVNRVRAGQTVAVRIPALGRSFTGAVEAVAPAADARTGKYPVHVLLPNADGTLKGGMYAELELAVAEHEGVTVPVDAIVERGGIPLVYVVAADVAREQRVEVLLRSEGRALVRGLSAGVPVVISGAQVLRDGTPVSVQGGQG